jgi:hypothetical protein
MADSQIREKTKKAYAGSSRKMKAWFEQQGLTFNNPPFNTDHVLAFFGSLTEQTPTPAASTLEGFRSALLYLYKKDLVVIDPTLIARLGQLMSGYKRTISDKKQSGDMKTFEGKHHITFSGYQLLANTLMAMGPVSGEGKSGSRINFNIMFFSWSFLILQWNLMARSASVASIMLQHLSWENDALIVTTPKHKGDQEGAHIFPRHVYANPINPVICPILALAVQVFSTSFLPGNESKERFKLFHGKAQEKRFQNIIRSALDKMDESQAAQLGAKPGEIASHSTRKGAASYCSSMVSGPSITQVFLRAGWSLGQIQDRYLFSGNGGDQFTGRVLSGLNNTDQSFKTLPPYFTSTDSIPTLQQWGQILPNYKDYPHAFKYVCNFLLCSLSYHESFLRSHLLPTHPLFNSYLFASGYINTIKSLITVDSPIVKVTGIPAHLIIATEVSKVNENLNRQSQLIIEKCEQLPVELEEKIMNRFHINGAIPVTMSDMRSFFNNDMVKELSQKQIVERKEEKEEKEGDRRFKSFPWPNGTIHPVPQGFTLPTSHIKDIWNLWWNGHIANQIRPYHLLKACDVPTQGSQLSKTKTIMKKIECIIRQHKVIEENQQIWSLGTERCAEIFDKGYKLLLEELNLEEDRQAAATAIATLVDYTKGYGGGAKRRKKAVEERRENTTTATATTTAASKRPRLLAFPIPAVVIH